MSSAQPPRAAPRPTPQVIGAVVELDRGQQALVARCSPRRNGAPAWRGGSRRRGAASRATCVLERVVHEGDEAQLRAPACRSRPSRRSGQQIRHVAPHGCPPGGHGAGGPSPGRSSSRGSTVTLASRSFSAASKPRPNRARAALDRGRRRLTAAGSVDRLGAPRVALASQHDPGLARRPRRWPRSGRGPPPPPAGRPRARDGDRRYVQPGRASLSASRTRWTSSPRGSSRDRARARLLAARESASRHVLARTYGPLRRRSRARAPRKPRIRAIAKMTDEDDQDRGREWRVRAGRRTWIGAV